MKFIAVKERESQRWFIAGTTQWSAEKYYPPGRVRQKVRNVQKSWVYPKPEHVSPFIERHEIVEAANIEEAQCLISNWK